MFNLKKLATAMVISTLTISFAPVAMADDDYDDDDRVSVTQQKKGNYISSQKAKQIAQSRVKGTVKSIDFDRNDDGYGATYDVEIRNSKGLEYDVKINAKTGKVIYVKRDYND